MKVGVLGSGDVAKTLAGGFLKHGAPSAAARSRCARRDRTQSEDGLSLLRTQRVDRGLNDRVAIALLTAMTPAV